MRTEEQYIRFHFFVIASSVALIAVALVAGSAEYNLFGPTGNRSTVAVLLFVWITCLGTLLVLSRPWRTLRSGRSAEDRERLGNHESRGHIWWLLTVSLLAAGLGLIWSLGIALSSLEGRFTRGIFVTTALISLPVLLNFVLSSFQYALVTDRL